MHMNTVIIDISMSLDGFITAANRTPEEPTGAGGHRLVEWAFGSDEQNRRYLENAGKDLGAVIAGRETYDTSVPWWGADGPAQRTPVFVVTHEAPAESPENGVYTFVTSGIHDALDQARAAAGDRVVAVMGGANLIRQYLAAGLVDEVSLHVVPVLFGTGTRLFEQFSEEHVHLETLEVINTPTAIHTRYRVLK
jgi:dihydrofolate reductase